MNYLDLFSGIGGFALGAYWAGMHFEKHYFSEVDKYCVELYQKRFPDAIPLGDIREINCEELADTVSIRQRQSAEQANAGGEGGTTRMGLEVSDSGRELGESSARMDWIITGGFPCQDISISGKGAGIRGERSGLWFEMHRVIRELRPRYVIAENVGALTHRGLDTVLSSLAEIGYDAEWQDIRAEDVGAPHRRERIWIIAYPNGEGERRRTLDAEMAGAPGVDVSYPNGAGCEERRGAESVREAHPATERLREVADSVRSVSESGAGRRGVREGDKKQRELADSAFSQLPYAGEGLDSERRQTVGLDSSRWWAAQSYLGCMADGLPPMLVR